jgi:hypothetical protein
MLLKPSEVSLCTQNPGFPEPLCIRSKRAALVAWWRGDVSFVQAQRMGLDVRGPKAIARCFPDWFERYLLADVAPGVKTPIARR